MVNLDTQTHLALHARETVEHHGPKPSRNVIQTGVDGCQANSRRDWSKMRNKENGNIQLLTYETARRLSKCRHCEETVRGTERKGASYDDAAERSQTDDNAFRRHGDSVGGNCAGASTWCWHPK